jgi:hypothetical protein
MDESLDHEATLIERGMGVEEYLGLLSGFW